MPSTTIHTRTAAIGNSYEKLDAAPNDVLTIFASGRDVYVVCGTVGIENATDERAFKLPTGAALEMNPAPRGDVFVRTDVAGEISYWYS